MRNPQLYISGKRQHILFEPTTCIYCKNHWDLGQDLSGAHLSDCARLWPVCQIIVHSSRLPRSSPYTYFTRDVPVMCTILCNAWSTHWVLATMILLVVALMPRVQRIKRRNTLSSLSILSLYIATICQKKHDKSFENIKHCYWKAVFNIS